MMYLHAYQSYVWNKVISYRLREYGHRVVVGDLVLAGKSVGDATLDDEGITEAQEAWPEAEPSEATSGEVNVIESEEQAQKHSIFDVVFPLPGHGVVYPPHCKAKYVEIMEADGMHPDDMKRPQKEFSLGGAYRSILARAEDLEWWGRPIRRHRLLFLTSPPRKMVKYSDPNANVCLTDLDRLKGADQDVKDDPNGAWAGVFVEFSLKPSCYATMMLRELTKQRSDVAFQAGQQH